MELGRHLRELCANRIAPAICLALAVFAAVSVVYRVSLLPPGLESRAIETASAKTEVLVEGPVSTVLDLRMGASDIEGMTNRAVLIGNVMVSPPVLRYIGERAGVPPDSIQAQAPLTPDFPRPLVTQDEGPKTSDLLRSTDQYRLNIQTDPAVPVITIYAQAPTAPGAETLANGAVTGLRDYLADAAASSATPSANRVTLTQLGRASGEVINGGVRTQLAALAFLIVLALASATAIFLGRVRRAWQQEEPLPAARRAARS